MEKIIEETVKSERWQVERTESEIIDEIRELLLEILGPMSNEILINNINAQKVGKIREIDLPLLSENLVSEISLLMDPTQARQIGGEIQSIIRTVV